VTLSGPNSPTSLNDSSPNSWSHLQRATQFLTRVREIFPDDGSKEESFSHFGKLMLPLHGAIMHELSGLEEEESLQLTSSSGERLRVADAVKHEEYEAVASLLSRNDLLDDLPQYLEDVKNTMITMRKFELKMLSESRQLYNRSQFILCRYRYGQQGLQDTHSQLKSLFRDRLDLLRIVEEVLGIPSKGETPSFTHTSPSLSPSSSRTDDSLSPPRF